MASIQHSGLTTGEDQPKGDDATRPEEAEVSQQFTFCNYVESLA
jgi:hypothetical protein